MHVQLLLKQKKGLLQEKETIALLLLCGLVNQQKPRLKPKQKPKPRLKPKRWQRPRLKQKQQQQPKPRPKPKQWQRPRPKPKQQFMLPINI